MAAPIKRIEGFLISFLMLNNAYSQLKSINIQPLLFFNQLKIKKKAFRHEVRALRKYVHELRKCPRIAQSANARGWRKSPQAAQMSPKKSLPLRSETLKGQNS
ncbi:MAG: hypothetical protein LBG47_01255 [Prevotellaceae bacterium]|nr:hypothetical protein [Prevotellaceae bacterium]